MMPRVAGEARASGGKEPQTLQPAMVRIGPVGTAPSLTSSHFFLTCAQRSKPSQNRRVLIQQQLSQNRCDLLPAWLMLQEARSGKLCMDLRDGSLCIVCMWSLENNR